MTDHSNITKRIEEKIEKIIKEVFPTHVVAHNPDEQFHADLLEKVLVRRILEPFTELLKSEISETVEGLRLEKWKKTRPTMLISYYNGELGYHTGNGEHQRLTIGTLEEMNNSHFNQAVEELDKAIDAIKKELE